MNVFNPFGTEDNGSSENKSPLTPEEAAHGYYWAEDKFEDIILVYVNKYNGEITIKDLEKENVYHSFGDIKLLEKVNYPEDYSEIETTDENEEDAFTRRKLRSLYAGIISAFTITLFLMVVLPRKWLLPFTFSGTTITTVTNVVIMLITVGLWKWKIFAEEKVGPTVDALSDTLDEFERAGMTLERISDFEPIMVAIAEGVGSMDEEEIQSAAKAIRQFFNSINELNDANGLEVDEDKAEEVLDSWKEDTQRG